MNNGSFAKETPENRISLFHLLAFIIMLPFDRYYSEVILISLLLHTLIHFTKTRWKSVFTIQNLVFTAVFLIGIAGMAWSHDRPQAIKDTLRQLALLLFPFILSATGLILQQYRKGILVIFGLTCIGTILYLYADAFRIILYYHLPFNKITSLSFINHNFSLPIGLHATYFSMYISLSLSAYLFYLIKESRNGFKFAYLLGILVLFAGLLQLASRSVLFVTLFLLVPVIAVSLFRRRQRLFFAGTWLIVLGLVSVSFSHLDAFKKRYVINLANDLATTPVNHEVNEPRVVRWHHAWQIIKQSPLTGHGSGSEKRLLMDEYYKHRLYNSYLNELNAHNQYISMAIKTGVIGLLCYLIALGYGAWVAWRKKDILVGAFVALISVVSFSENILDVNKGIFFVAFFLSFLVKSGPERPVGDS